MDINSNCKIGNIALRKCYDVWTGEFSPQLVQVKVENKKQKDTEGFSGSEETQSKYIMY